MGEFVSLKEALRLIRVFHDLSKIQVADRVGLSRSYITELEAGDKKVTLEVLQKYADGFSIPLSSLMLFAERANDRSFGERARAVVASKVIKMLDWVATLAEEQREHLDADA